MPEVYGFLRRPRWVAFTLLIVVLMVAMVNLGLWQLRRLDQRQRSNRDVSERSSLPAAELAELVRPTSDRDAVLAVQWRTVSVTGTYDVAHQTFVRDRSLDGRAGLHVVTPLTLADGSAVLVNRGWVPPGADARATPTAPAPPAGPLTLQGRIRPTQLRGLIGPIDPPQEPY